MSKSVEEINTEKWENEGMSESFNPTTPPNTPERMREAKQWMARQGQALADKLALAMLDAAEEARRFRDGIELIQLAFDNPIEPTL